MRNLPDNKKFLVAFSFAGEQRDLVSAIAGAVENELGTSTVFLDEWFEYYIAGNDADLKLQRIYDQDCDLVVVCVSEKYGNKPWTQAEHAAIRARYMKAQESDDSREKDKIFLLRVGDGDVPGILLNAIVPDVREKSFDDTVQLIIKRFELISSKTEAEGSFPISGNSWPNSQPLLDWSMADHREAREAFSKLLQREAPWRYLSLRGPSDVGKSLITQQMLANALRLKSLPNLACGRLDFKGTTNIDIKVFVQDLDIPSLPESQRLNEQLGYILDALKKNSKPALLIFDTYEAASSEAQDWVEKQLLPSIIRNTWLRVVIVGQRVPERNVIWKSDASPVIELYPPSASDWFEYGKRHRTDLTLELVKIGCKLVYNKASFLAQMFGPSN